jgi:hypothetical protein
MPEREPKERARRDKRQGKSPSTQAGEFVREEFHHVREGKHGARSAKQAIAIGLSKARRAGVDLPANGQSSETRHKAQQDRESAQHPHAPSRTRSRATSRALKHEGHAAGSHRAISRQSHAAVRQRSSSDRSAAARKASRTKGAGGRAAAARKAARTRQDQD